MAENRYRVIRHNPEGIAYGLLLKLHSRYEDANSAICESVAVNKLGGGSAAFRAKLRAGLIDGLQMIPTQPAVRQTMELPKTVTVEVVTKPRRKYKKRRRK